MDVKGFIITEVCTSLHLKNVNEPKNLDMIQIRIYKPTELFYVSWSGIEY